VGLSVRLWISKSLEGLLCPVLWRDKGLHGCFVRSVGVRHSLESGPGKIHGATVVREGARSTPSSCCLCGLQEGRGEGTLSGFFFFFFFASQCSPDLLSLGPPLSTLYLLSFLLSFYTSQLLLLADRATLIFWGFLSQSLSLQDSVLHSSIFVVVVGV
jgi:hypothetical protein